MANTLRETIPTELVTHVTAMCGTLGEQWFEQLPQMIVELESEWSISVQPPFPGIEYNYVAPARMQSGEDVVVKIAPPFEYVEIFGEAKHLRTLNGGGEIALLAEDRGRKAILIERALPGEALFEKFKADPPACIQAAIDVLRSILRPPPDDMTDVDTLDKWFSNFRRYSETDFPAASAEKAFEIYERLSVQRGCTFYIHGDFHPGNVVTATRSPFLAIDPKGIVGHVGYDIAVFLINLYRWRKDGPNFEKLFADAIAQFSLAFEISESEIREWGFAHTVIGAWWNFDDMPELYDPAVAMPDIWNV